MALSVTEKFMNEVHQLLLTHGYSKLFHVVTPLVCNDLVMTVTVEDLGLA